MQARTVQARPVTVRIRHQAQAIVLIHHRVRVTSLRRQALVRRTISRQHRHLRLTVRHPVMEVTTRHLTGGSRITCYIYCG